MKLFALLMILSSAAFADINVIVDETFKTTFSDYNELDKMLTCRPGHQGGYPTYDYLTLKRHAVELGFTVSDGDFHAENFLVPPTFNLKKPGKRPFEEGCKPALDHFKKALEGLQTVEVTVHRRVTSYPSTNGRTYRKRNGDAISTRYITSELIYESYEVEIAGFTFTLGQVLNGK